MKICWREHARLEEILFSHLTPELRLVIPNKLPLNVLFFRTSQVYVFELIE